ncbi:MAG: methyltransferase family protein [Acidobacteriota bacterium]
MLRRDPAGPRLAAIDAGVPVDEIKVGWTLTVVGCALAAWLTPSLIPWPEFLSERPWWAGGRTPVSAGVGAIFLIPGILLALSAVRTLGRPRRLVTTGPYRWVRHPYLLAVLLLLVGVIVVLRSLPAVVLLIPAVRLTIERARREDHNLRLRFGERHEAYCRSIPLLLPLAPPLPRSGLPEAGALADGDVHLEDLSKGEAALRDADAAQHDRPDGGG